MNFKKQILIEATQLPHFLIEKEPEHKTISLSDIYSSISDYQLLHCHLFLRFYWSICKISVIETSTSIKKANLFYNNFIKSIYICRKSKGIDKFLPLKLIDESIIYVNSSLSLYKYLNFRNPGLFECFGLCHKNLRKRLLSKLNSYPNLKFEPIKYELNQQLGGTILLNNKGKVVFTYRMRYLGDYCPPENIISFAKNFFGLNMKLEVHSISTFEKSNEVFTSQDKENKETNDMLSNKNSDILYLNK